MIFLNDCLTQLKTIPDRSIDSLITDPPAGISFMGKAWDGDKGGRSGWVAWMTEVMRECHRVLKPGAHGLVWAIPRTSHWTATALEDAGFEVRDVITHLFGQGFPKSLDISKAIDKAAGAEREVIGVNPNHRTAEPVHTMLGNPHTGTGAITAPSTDAAKQWSGWGTALKPASEHWILVRKPVSEKNVAANVLKWGTGGINVDATRIGSIGATKWSHQAQYAESGWRTGHDIIELNKGRFPANLVLSHSPHCTDDQCDIECAIRALDEQADQSASRFFYCAKISPNERNAGLEEMPDREGGVKNTSGRGYSERDPMKPIIVKNHHPTVKPQKLMRYLCRLITPPAGTVLDPFMGSGSTGMAAKAEGFEFVGIEREADYFEIAKNRINAI